MCHATVQFHFIPSQEETQTVMVMKCPSNSDSNPDTDFVQAWSFVPRRGTLGFSVLRFWLFFRSVFGFCAKRLRFLGFSVHRGLRIFRFLSIRISVFLELLAVFRFCYPMRLLGFPICPICVPVCLRKKAP